MKPGAWEPRKGLKKVWACLPLFLIQSVQKERRGPAQSQPVLLWSEAMFPSGFPSWAQLNYHSSIMKAWNEGGGSSDTKSFRYFLCLISCPDLKRDPATASSPSQKPKTYWLALSFLSLRIMGQGRSEKEPRDRALPGDGTRGSYQQFLLSPPSLSSRELCAPSSPPQEEMGCLL